jgi:23S rRNA (cytosine1962-C5)-methyltransferase
MPAMRGSTDFRTLLTRALAVRESLIRSKTTQAIRVFSGEADGLDGVFLDVYADGAVLIVYEGRAPQAFDVDHQAQAALEILQPALGVRAVYLKPFAKDRSSMGGELPACTTDPKPIAGEALPEVTLVREHDWTLEIHLYDGLSTGVFLDQRDNRAFVAQWSADRLRTTGKPPAVLNTFAYTCAFSVAAAVGGAITTSVDVSPRYLDWGKRNFAHNGREPDAHRFAKMDTLDFLGYAHRKGLRYDLIILDPPSFGSGNKKKGIRPWSAVDGYSKLVRAAADVLNAGGTILASTNTQQLCRPGVLEKEIAKALGRPPKWIDLPPPPVDFARDKDRFAAVAFRIQ